MKKILLITMTFVLGMALALPAWAIENEFGGYWRTRAFSQTDFDGNDGGTGTLSAVDTRTRLYYTAIFSENLKFVNKFEFNSVWGDDDGGDIGADATDIFKVKNSYADFNVNNVNFKVGMQAAVISRGLMFDDDFSGVTVTAKIGDTITLPITWMKISSGDMGADASYANTSIDSLTVNPAIALSDGMTVKPLLTYVKAQGEDTDLYYVGADVDAKIDNIGVWGTLIYNTGTLADDDVSGYLVAAGADAGLVHGQFMYASGDDDTTDNDVKNFVSPDGQCYYWSEILGYGLFGDTTFYDRTNPNSPDTTISNVMAINVGTTIKPMEKLTCSADLWYAALIEETATSNDETDLGIEIDLLATYQLVDNLKIDVVAAYLMAGDAFGDEDATEFGTRLSFSF